MDEKQLLLYVGVAMGGKNESFEAGGETLGEGSVAVSPAGHSRCSIFTFGGLRKVRFFFSFLPFVFAWKFRQLSTRPSRLS